MDKKKSSGEYILYILKCNDGTFYTGITNDLQNRLKTHRAGKGSKYVRARLPVKLVYQESGYDKSTAAKREYEVKRWSRREKIINFRLSISN